MVEVIGENHGLSWVYDPPVMSGVMETRDRWLVADNPVSFDSDYMVFVSPAPVHSISKLLNFNFLLIMLTLHMWLLVIVTVLVFAGTQRMGKGEHDDWRHFSNCSWFSFSTFIGESVMR
jgi:hypothetical protein